jgi:hypothetical protein
LIPLQDNTNHEDDDDTTTDQSLIPFLYASSKDIEVRYAQGCSKYPAFGLVDRVNNLQLEENSLPSGLIDPLNPQTWRCIINWQMTYPSFI